jgi:hypothetical protein
MERLDVVEIHKTDEKQIVQAMDMSIKYPATALRQECMVRALEFSMQYPASDLAEAAATLGILESGKESTPEACTSKVSGPTVHGFTYICDSTDSNYVS